MAEIISRGSVRGGRGECQRLALMISARGNLESGKGVLSVQGIKRTTQ